MERAAREEIIQNQNEEIFFSGRITKKGAFIIIIKALLLGLAGFSLCLATISGTVTDTSGVILISGAVVLLEKDGLIDTTGADGRFTLTVTAHIAGKNYQRFQRNVPVMIHNGVLSLYVKERSAVEIIVYTVQGKSVTRIQMTMDAGMHSMILPQLGTGVYLYKVKSGSSDFLLKSPLIERTSGGAASPVLKFSSGKALAKQTGSAFAINDVIKVAKEGYLDSRVSVINSDTSGMEIRMIVCAGTVRDTLGNVYQAVRLGNQMWTIQDLRITRFNDSTPIPNGDQGPAWSSRLTGAYCFCASSTNGLGYGVLYNWYAVSTGKLAPLGWRVPNEADWFALQNYLIANGYNYDGTLTGNKIAKSMAAKTGWNPNTGAGTIGNNLSANNSSGFSALPGTYRTGGGSFYIQNNYGYWWSATSIDGSSANIRVLNYSTSSLAGSSGDNRSGFSVRLIRDVN